MHPSVPPVTTWRLSVHRVVGMIIALRAGLGAVDAPTAWAVVRHQAGGDAVELRRPGELQPLSACRVLGTVVALHRTNDGLRLLLTVQHADGSSGCHTWSPTSAELGDVPLPSGVSIRCVLQAPDGGWVGTADTGSAVVNGSLVVAQPDGSGLRRLSVDRYGAADPTVLADGRLVYTRWHGPATDTASTGGLVALNPDGTNAMGLVDGPRGGALRQARDIPGTGCLIAIATDAPTATAGRLVICDPARGPEMATSVSLAVPAHTARERFRHPWPVDVSTVVAAWSPTGTAPWTIVRVHGVARERLWDDAADLDLPVYWGPLPPPLPRPSLVDWRLTHGWIYIQDLYAAGRIANQARGSAAAVRIATVAAERDDTGAIRWVPKPLGTAPVAADGSVFAQVPARIPIAFEVLDRQGQVLSGMSRWTMVQRGERVSCLGCHAPPTQVPRYGGAVAFGLPPVELRVSSPPAEDPDQAAWLRGEQRRIQELVLALFGSN